MNLPQPDYYHGRTVTAVEDAPGGLWDIVLDGDIRIRSFNPTYPKPVNEDEDGNESSSLVGLQLQTTTLDANGTALYFGTKDNPGMARVNFEPEHYGIRDPRYGEDFVNSQMDAAGRVMETPPEPEGRTADGPTGEGRQVLDAAEADEESDS